MDKLNLENFTGSELAEYCGEQMRYYDFSNSFEIKGEPTLESFTYRGGDLENIKIDMDDLVVDMDITHSDLYVIDKDDLEYRVKELRDYAEELEKANIELKEQLDKSNNFTLNDEEVREAVMEVLHGKIVTSLNLTGDGIINVQSALMAELVVQVIEHKRTGNGS